MLAIRVNNKFLQLEADAAITVRISFDVLNFDKKEGSYTVPFSVPNTGYNRKVLNFPGRITNAAHELEYSDVQIWHSGKIMYIGNLVIEVSDSEIEGYIEIGNGSFWAQTQGVKLNELDIEDDFTPITDDPYDYLNAAADNSYPAYQFAIFPIYAANYMDSSELEDSIVDAYTNYVNDYQNDALRVDPTGYRDNTIANIITAQPYICYIIDKLFAYYEISIKENWLLDTEYAQLTLLKMKSGRYPISSSRLFNYMFRFSQLSSINLSEFIVELEKLLAIKFLFDNESRSVRIIDINTVLTSRSINDVTALTRSNDGIKHEKITDYVLKQTTGSDDYATSHAEQDYYTSVEDYLVQETVVVESTQRGVSDEELVVINVPAGVQHTAHDTAFSYVPNYKVKSGGTITLMPRTDANYSDIMSCKTPLRLLFYRGKQVYNDLSLADGVRPLGTAGTTDYYGNDIAGAEHSLYWGGAKGLYAKRWKEYFYWHKNIRKPIERYVDFSASEIKHLDPTKKLRIEGVNYVIEAYEITFFTDKMSSTKCDLVVV